MSVAVPYSTTYPNGQTLVSSALTLTQIQQLMQTLTCGVLGINPPDYSKVRVDWQTEGQPFQNAKYDICYIACAPKEEYYNKVRDRTYSGTDVVTETWVFTKGWHIAWVLYGPNSSTNAQRLWDALFMDYFNDQLSLSALYPIPDPPEPTRMPENINAQWFERADFYIDMYEQVTETINDGAVTSVEIKILDKDGQVADFTVTK